MKLFEDYINSLNSKKDEKEAYLKNLAQGDYEVGHPFSPDDFREFQKLCREDGYNMTQNDFNTYFEFFDEIRSEEGEEDEES